MSPAFPRRSGRSRYGTGLVRVRSPLLAESLLMSFPPGTEMFQFPGFASLSRYSLRSGFPHSEIHGSKLVRSSPWLIAAYHVLHRLSAPRHPPNALKSLDHSHYRCPRADPHRDRTRDIEKDLMSRDPSETGAVRRPITLTWRPACLEARKTARHHRTPPLHGDEPRRSGRTFSSR